tara:strand:- start:46 stop:615 length:570 start_codon:yes stop_codon:yes gene_type:complete
MKLEKSFIIYDTEYTSWSGSQKRNWNLPNEHRELVAIGALKIKLEKNKYIIEDSLKILFIPRINNILSNYFINLTSITNDEINKYGYDYQSGMKLFLDFCGNLNMYSYGNDYHIFEENYKLYKLDNNLNKDKFKDIRPYFDKFNINTNNYTSGTIYKHFNIKINNEQIHDPLFDSLSIFKTIEYLIKYA